MQRSVEEVGGACPQAGFLQRVGSKHTGWGFPQLPKEGFNLDVGCLSIVPSLESGDFSSPPFPALWTVGVQGYSGSVLLPSPDATPQFQGLLNSTYTYL